MDKSQLLSNNKRPIVEVDRFSIKLGNKLIVDDLSFSVNRGEIFGFLGSNGSGKTTTLRALLGLYKPSKGKILIDGQKFSVDSPITIGYLPEERGLYKKEPVINIMTYFGRLKGMPEKEARDFSMQYLKDVDLLDKAKTRLDKLSGGQQQKIQLGIAIMNNPQLLILDEPTKGFDPINRRLLMNMIFDLHKKGSTIIMVSHQMDEVEKICDRIVLLKDGKSRAYGTVDSIKKLYGGASIDQIFVDIYGEPDNQKLADLLNENKGDSNE